jgi:hypothetical protein
MLEDPYGKAEVVKMMDIFMGVPSILLDTDPSAPARRRLYGRAGAHRPKSYGVEYRALGNFWVQSPELTQIMYRLADVAVRLTLEGESGKIIEQANGKEVVRAINSSDATIAKRITETTLVGYLEQDLFAKIMTEHPPVDLYRQWKLAA